MSNESPLLKKARSKQSKNYRRKKKNSGGFSIPEKGRGRIVVFAILAFVAFKVVASRGNDSSKEIWVDTASSSDTTEAVIKNKNKDTDTTKMIKKTDKIKNALFNLKPKMLEWTDIKESVGKKTPTLKASIDTVLWKRKKVIRYFSIDTNMQKSGDKYMRRYHPKYGAVAIIQPRTGRVLSLISYNNPEEQSLGDALYGSSFFPAASVIKTVTAAAVIDKNGLNSKSLLKMNGKNHTLYTAQLEKELKTYRELTLGEAYAYSINPIFGRLGIYYSGANSLYGYAEKFGFNEPVPFELPMEISQFKMPVEEFELAETASGFNQNTTITPILGALMAGAVSNDGKMIRPTLVDSVVDLESGTNIYTRKPSLWRITTNVASANELEKLMNGVARYGTARTPFKNIKTSSRFRDFSFGGKTGSVDKDGYGRADWFIGFLKDPKNANQHLSVGVFTVHGANWTVHSSTIGAEMMRKQVRSVQIAEKEKEKALNEEKKKIELALATESDKE
jgi:peptidoglycan glycosyltransferase